MQLSKEEIYVIFVSLLAMVQDNHSGQDTMTDGQWDTAERLYERFLKEVENERGPDNQDG